MQTRAQKGLAVLAAMLLAACGADQVTSSAEVAAPRFQTTTPPPSVRFSEFHYDNAGTDVNERIEVSFPTGTALADYSVVLYNGSNGSVYGTYPLSAATVTACSAERSVAVIATPGLQNGAPDGFALAGPSGLIEFLSYEGTFAGVGGVANGVTSTDVGVSETGGSTYLADGSIARSANGSWSLSLASNTFGSCNDGTTGGPTAGPIATVTVSPATATITFGSTSQLAATAKDAGGLTVAGTTFTWTSSDENIATVSTSGLVTAVAPGSATITATAAAFSGSAVITVSEPATLPAVRFSEIHYDNAGDDFGEALEIEGPAGTSLNGWQVLLYNGSNGRVYDARALTGTIPATCSTRGVIVLEYTTSFLQNGPDGMALVNAAGEVVEFLSYEGKFTAADGAAAGTESRNMFAQQSGAVINTSLQRSKSDTWSSAPDNFGLCNGIGTRTPRTTLSFGFRTPFDEALPVGFEDLLSVTRRVDGVVQDFDTPLVSETPAIAEVLPNNVIRGKAEGTARFRATAPDGFTLTYELPIRVATAGNAVYDNHVSFGTPVDASASDDFIITREQSVVSYSPVRNTPNWVAYNLEASHIGGQDRCDCFTTDPALPESFAKVTTFDYVGSGYSRGHLVKSQDRTSGSLDNARTFYLSNIVPQTGANNSGPWLQLENYLTDKARNENKEVFIVAGVAGSIGTLNDKGVVTIPASLWKVAIVLPRNSTLADVNAGLVPDEVIGVIMPNVSDMPSGNWRDYATTVDAVELLSGYDVLSLLNDQIEIALESNTKAPVAAINGPFTILAGETVSLSATGSTDVDGDDLTYAWAFGDGATGTGENVTHRYTTPGTYTAAVTVTDIRTLFDQASTTVTVLSSAQGVTAAAALVEQLGVTGKLNRGLANSLAVKVRNAGASITRESAESARGQLGALVNEIDALVRSGRITAANAAEARAYLVRVIASLEFGV